MLKFERAEIGNICLVQETEDGRIRQIGLTADQSRVLQILLASISKEEPLTQMGCEFDLVLKSSLCNKCRTVSKGTLKTFEDLPEETKEYRKYSDAIIWKNK